MIESSYLMYQNKKIKFKAIPINGNYVIDLECLIQINIKNPSQQRKVKRGRGPIDRQRIGATFRWPDSIPIISPTSIKFSNKNFGWLGKQWTKYIYIKEGKKFRSKTSTGTKTNYPTLNEIKEGFKKEEELNILKINENSDLNYKATLA